MKMKSWLWAWGALTGAAVLILGVLDWITGYELNFFVFYFLPVSAAAWFFGLAGAVTLAILSAMVWFGADIINGHIYSSSAHAVWNTMIRLVSFLAIGWSVARVRHLLDRERETATVLRKSLSQIKVLETFLPICAQCKKIRNQQGMWQHLEVYIEQHSNTQFSHGYCPECARRALAEAGLLDEKTDQGGGHVQ